MPRSHDGQSPIRMIGLRIAKGTAEGALIRRLRAMKAAGNIAGALASEEVRAFLVGFGRHNPATTPCRVAVQAFGKCKAEQRNSDRQKKPR